MRLVVSKEFCRDSSGPPPLVPLPSMRWRYHVVDYEGLWPIPLMDNCEPLVRFHDFLIPDAKIEA